ncbi:MAG TPA: methylated-DNA--[protein]-cysteine S-methyltransferase [Polyangiaceae bacterium]|nr:methylated-DNA--[protein]-cysteine S-methyltransferase [Polyangiaceae bacterium]
MIDARWQIDRLDSPLGPFTLVLDDRGRLHAAGWVDGHARMDRLLGARSTQSAAIEPARDHGVARAFRAYFGGDRAALTGVPIALGGTVFQNKVWNALLEIPWGETRSYADVARRIGRPEAVRAVGLANGANPIAIVVPCHRVIGTGGALTGYGGGLERKRWLLGHEGVAGPGQLDLAWK